MLLPALLLSLPAQPCAAIFVEDGGSASTDAQEAILHQRDGAVEVTWRVQVVHDTGRLGWIVPVYGAFESIEDADPAVFDTLRDATAPQVWIQGVDDGGDDDQGGGCGGGDRALSGEGGAQSNSQDLGVEVVAEGFTGTYAWTVLSGTDEGEVLAWLDEAGFDVGPSGPAIAAYVAEGGVQLLALTVETQHDDAGRRELPAVRVRYAGDSLRYPSLMGLYGMPAEISTRVYVLGDQRATLTGTWSATDLDYQEGALGGGEDAVNEAYAGILRDLVGDQPRYVTVWSGSWEGGWLTRFDTIAVREAHTADAVFLLDGGQSETSGTLYLWESGGQAAIWLLPGLLGVGAGLRRRRLSAR